MNLAQLLIRAARAFPHAPALYLGRRLVCDHRGFAARASGLAGALTSRLALSPGDRVGILMANAPEYLEILYATWVAGLVAVPINAKLHPKEATFILQDAGARLLFISDALASGLSPLQASLPELRYTIVPGTDEYTNLRDAAPLIPQSCDSGQIAWLFYTSGTTGRPKGVMLTHQNLLTMAMSYFTDVDAINHRDAFVYAAPMSHGAGLYSIPHVLAGARHVVPDSGGFDVQELEHLARHHGNTSTFAAPTMIRRLADHFARTGNEPTGFKTIVYGGGPMYLEDMRRALNVIGNRFVQIYGQGESPMTITALSRRHHWDKDHPRYIEHLRSVGLAQTPVEIRIVDPEGQTMTAGGIGEVLVKSDTVMKGYWNNPQATAETILDGWLSTGDLGSLDEDGFLTLRDRSKDVIISGGANIYPREVEEVLLIHPAVQEVAVIGRPHPEWSEEVVAFVVLRTNQSATPQELEALCLNHIARFKRPKFYRFVSGLPKNSYGKVLKTELRRQLTEDLVE